MERSVFYHWATCDSNGGLRERGRRPNMNKILDITRKDLLQMLRDWKFLFFLLVMPAGFTLLMGFIFGGVGQADTDP